jgi:hypothetical protein
LWWNHETAGEVKRLVEQAGGEVWTVQGGRLTDALPIDELNGTMHTAMDRFSRRDNARKSRAAVEAAIARGAWPAPRVPLGYVRGEDGRLEVDPATAPAVRAAFRLRATGATVGQVRAMLRERGIDVSYAQVGRLLGQRAVLGEIHFGLLKNLEAHDPIVLDRDLFNRVQRIRVPAGRRTKSERILARLGVLRCGSCGGLMSASIGHRGTTAIYRCGAHAGDPCPRRVTISAPMVESLVVDVVRDVLADDEGRASAAENLREAEAERDAAAAARAATVAAFDGLADDVSAAREKLARLRAAEEEAQARVDRLGGTAADRTVTVEDWDLLTIEERRSLIRAVVASVEVAPGRGGVHRCTVNLNGK